MNDKTNQLIFEKYQQIQEASPIGMGQRLGNWAKRKVANALPTFTGDWKHRLEGEKQTQTEIIKLKQQFERFKGQFRLGNNVQARHLYTFLAKNNVNTDTKTMQMLKQTPNFYLSDDEVNEIIKNIYQEQLESDLTKTPTANQQQPNNTPQQPQQQSAPKINLTNLASVLANSQGGSVGANKAAVGKILNKLMRLGYQITKV